MGTLESCKYGSLCCYTPCGNVLGDMVVCGECASSKTGEDAACVGFEESEDSHCSDFCLERDCS